MQTVLEWDRYLLKLINSQWHNTFFDAVLPYVRIAEFWMPFYFFLLLYGLMNYKLAGLRWFGFAILTVILTNYISSDLIKEHIWRIRPCNNPALADWLRTPSLKYRPQSSSFTSSHAANHFGLAMFLYHTAKKVLGKWAYLFFVWAFMIGYAQVYVGVHYPIDILGGSAVGLAAGYTTASLFNKYKDARVRAKKAPGKD